MRQLSVRDLLLALPQFKNEIELIHPDNDAVVFATLDAVGFDTRQGVTYVAQLHRDMQDKVAVGFMALGEYNVDPKFNKFIDMTDRIVIAGLHDRSLAEEMLNIQGKKFTYINDDEPESKASLKRPHDPRYYDDSELLAMGYTAPDEDEGIDAEVGSVEDYESVASQIAMLNGIKKLLRGE